MRYLEGVEDDLEMQQDCPLIDGWQRSGGTRLIRVSGGWIW